MLKAVKNKLKKQISKQRSLILKRGTTFYSKNRNINPTYKESSVQSNLDGSLTRSYGIAIGASFYLLG